jgi:hypothetical protein
VHCPGLHRCRRKLLKTENYRLLHQPVREGDKFALGWRVQNTMAGVLARHLACS